MIFIVIVQDNEIEMQTQGANKTTTRQYKNNKTYKTRMNHKPGGPCFAGCHRDPAPDKRTRKWMDG